MAYREACEDIILSVRRLEIPKDELIVIGGAALQLYGIRDSHLHTIDLVVSPERMTEILRISDSPDYASSYKIGHIGLMPQVTAVRKGVKDWGDRGNVTFMPAPNDTLYQASFNELRDEAIDVSDVLVSPPERILDWKRSVVDLKGFTDFNLLEDKADVRLIEDYLSNHTDGEPYKTYGGWKPGENPGIQSMRQAAFQKVLRNPRIQEAIQNSAAAAARKAVANREI